MQHRSRNIRPPTVAAQALRAARLKGGLRLGVGEGGLEMMVRTEDEERTRRLLKMK